MRRPQSATDERRRGRAGGGGGDRARAPRARSSRRTPPTSKPRRAGSTRARSTGCVSTTSGSTHSPPGRWRRPALEPLEREIGSADARRTASSSRSGGSRSASVGANFEARPNVALDVAGQLLKSLNAGVLRTGGAALRTVTVLVDEVLRPALERAGLPPEAVGLVRSADREGARVLVSHARARPARDPARQRPEHRRAGAARGARTASARSPTPRAAASSTCTPPPIAAKALALAEASLDRLGVCNRLNLALVDRDASERSCRRCSTCSARKGLDVRGDGRRRASRSTGRSATSGRATRSASRPSRSHVVDGLDEAVRDRERGDVRARRRNRHRGRRGRRALPRRLSRHGRVLARADPVHRRVRAHRRARDGDQRRPRPGPARAGHLPRPVAAAVPRRSATAAQTPMTVVVKLGSSLVVGGGGRVRRALLRCARPRDQHASFGEASRSASSPRARSRSVCPAWVSTAGRGASSRLQAASALGQARLQAAWDQALAPLHAAQVLLTAADVGDRTTYVNARGRADALFGLGAVPVVNENDATATDEITFGDNDALAAQVAVLLRARLLVLLTEVEGVYSRAPGTPGAVLLEEGSRAGEAVLGAASPLGRGGMRSKVLAAELAAAAGIPTVIAGGTRRLGAGADRRRRAARDADSRPHERNEPAFKLWLRFGKPVRGRIVVDAGARRALVDDGASLLAVGVLACEGTFEAGDAVELAGPDGVAFAKGIASVPARRARGRPRGVEVGPPRSSGGALVPPLELRRVDALAAVRLRGDQRAEARAAPRRRGRDRPRLRQPRHARRPRSRSRSCARPRANPRNHRYSASRGIPNLRRAICDLYARRFGVELDPETQAMTTIGAKEGLAHLMWVLVQPGDVGGRAEPELPDPPVRARLRRRGRGAGRRWGRSEDFFGNVVEAFERSRPRPRVLLLSFPHNPTTAVVDADFMQRVVDFAREQELFVVHDFAYADLALRRPRAAVDPRRPTGATEVAVELYTLTKSFSMAGWRVGFVVGNAEVVGALARLKSYLDYGTFQPIQIAAIVAMNEAPRLSRARSARSTARGATRSATGSPASAGTSRGRKGTMFVWAPIPEPYRDARLARVRGQARPRGAGRREPGRRLRTGRRRPRPLRAGRERAADRPGGGRAAARAPRAGVTLRPEPSTTGRPSGYQIESSVSGSKKWRRSASRATRSGSPVRAVLRGLSRAVTIVSVPAPAAISASAAASSASGSPPLQGAPAAGPTEKASSGKCAISSAPIGSASETSTSRVDPFAEGTNVASSMSSGRRPTITGLPMYPRSPGLAASTVSGRRRRTGPNSA